MTPSAMQSAFAKDWPLKGYLGLAIFLGAFVPFAVCQPSLAMFSDWQFFLLFVISVILMGALGFFISLPIAFMFLGPIYHLRAKLNGAPFRVGDHVQILIGPHQGRVVEVYDVWSERKQVRVDLDAQTKATVEDVFSFTQVCRANAA